MTSNLQLMRDAKASLRGKWGMAALATLVFVLVVGAAGTIGIGIGALLVIGPMTLGYILFLRSIHAGHQPDMDLLFSGFKDFTRAFLAQLLVGIFVWLWTLLLIIPGLIMGIAYSMTMFIIADDKDIRPLDAIRRSRDMMRGYKWKYFCLQLRFFGWLLLCALTCGILTFWIQPYMSMANLNFYNDVKADWEARK